MAIEPSFSLDVTVAPPALKTVKPPAPASGAAAEAVAGSARASSSAGASTRERRRRAEPDNMGTPKSEAGERPP